MIPPPTDLTMPHVELLRISESMTLLDGGSGLSNINNRSRRMNITS